MANPEQGGERTSDLPQLVTQTSYETGQMARGFDLKRIQGALRERRFHITSSMHRSSHVALLTFIIFSSLDHGALSPMNTTHEITAAKRKHLLKTYGLCPAGYTHEDIEHFLHLLYRMFSNIYTSVELRQVILSDPFDDSDPPRQLKLVDLADWLEAVVA